MELIPSPPLPGRDPDPTPEPLLALHLLPSAPSLEGSSPGPKGTRRALRLSEATPPWLPQGGARGTSSAHAAPSAGHCPKCSRSDQGLSLRMQQPRVRGGRAPALVNVGAGLPGSRYCEGTALSADRAWQPHPGQLQVRVLAWPLDEGGVQRPRVLLAERAGLKQLLDERGLLLLQLRDALALVGHLLGGQEQAGAVSTCGAPATARTPRRGSPA